MAIDDMEGLRQTLRRESRLLRSEMRILTAAVLAAGWAAGDQQWANVIDKFEAALATANRLEVVDYE